MTESAQVESFLCSSLPCTLHIFTRTRPCQMKHRIMISTLSHPFCSSLSDHRELRTKLCLSLNKLFWFTNQGFPHGVILPWILKDCSCDHSLQNLAEMPCAGSQKSEKQERGLCISIIYHVHHVPYWHTKWQNRRHNTLLPLNTAYQVGIHMCIETSPTVLHGEAHILQLAQSQQEQWNCYKRNTLH